MLLIRAMRLGVIMVIYLMVYSLIMIITNYNNFNQQGQSLLIGQIVGGFIGLLIQLWYLDSAKKYYAERLKAEGGGALI